MRRGEQLNGFGSGEPIELLRDATVTYGLQER